MTEHIATHRNAPPDIPEDGPYALVVVMATLTEEGAPVVNVHTAGGRFDEPHGQDFKQFADVLAQRLNDTVRALFDEIERAGDSDYDGLRLH